MVELGERICVPVLADVERLGGAIAELRDIGCEIAGADPVVPAPRYAR